MSEVERVRVNDDANDELEVSVENVRKAVKKLKKRQVARSRWDYK